MHTLRLVFSVTGEKHFLCPFVQNKIGKGEKFVDGTRKQDGDSTVVLSSLVDRQDQRVLLCWSKLLRHVHVLMHLRKSR